MATKFFDSGIMLRFGETKKKIGMLMLIIYLIISQN